MFTRFNGNVVPFADDSTSTNRTVFGGTTQSDDIDDNLNTNFKKGWEIVGLNDNPTREDFNAMGYTLGALTAYLYEMGISEWNASQNYRANSRVTGSDGKIYKSLTGTTGIPNVGKNPTTDAVNWKLEIITDYSTLTAKTTPIDADLIALADSTSSFSLNKLTWSNIKATLKTYFDISYVALTGNQTIAGIKTFSSSPIVPTPTTNFQAATKQYVDNKTVASSETIAGVIELATTAEAQAGTDDLRAITPLKLKNSVIGLGQTWQNMTESRALGVTYTNSTGKPIMVSVRGAYAANTGAVTIYVDWLDIGMSNVGSSGGGKLTIAGIVPNNSTYQVTCVNALDKWTELR